MIPRFFVRHYFGEPTLFGEVTKFREILIAWPTFAIAIQLRTDGAVERDACGAAR